MFNEGWIFRRRYPMSNEGLCDRVSTWKWGGVAVIFRPFSDYLQIIPYLRVWQKLMTSLTVIPHSPKNIFMSFHAFLMGSILDSLRVQLCLFLLQTEHIRRLVFLIRKVTTFNYLGVHVLKNLCKTLRLGNEAVFIGAKRCLTAGRSFFVHFLVWWYHRVGIFRN